MATSNDEVCQNDLDCNQLGICISGSCSCDLLSSGTPFCHIYCITQKKLKTKFNSCKTKFKSIWILNINSKKKGFSLICFLLLTNQVFCFFNAISRFYFNFFFFCPFVLRIDRIHLFVNYIYSQKHFL